MADEDGSSYPCHHRLNHSDSWPICRSFDFSFMRCLSGASTTRDGRGLFQLRPVHGIRLMIFILMPHQG